MHKLALVLACLAALHAQWVQASIKQLRNSRSEELLQADADTRSLLNTLAAFLLANDAAAAFSPSALGARVPASRQTSPRMEVDFSLDSPENAWLTEKGGLLLSWEQLLAEMNAPVLMDMATNEAEEEEEEEGEEDENGLDEYGLPDQTFEQKHDEVSQEVFNQNIETLRSYNLTDEWIRDFILPDFPQLVRVKPENLTDTVQWLEKQYASGKEGVRWMTLNNPCLLGYGAELHYEPAMKWIWDMHGNPTKDEESEKLIEALWLKSPQRLQVALDNSIQTDNVANALAEASASTSTMLKSLVTDVTNQMKKGQRPTTGERVDNVMDAEVEEGETEVEESENEVEEGKMDEKENEAKGVTEQSSSSESS